MHALSSFALGIAGNLLVRSAEVTLKEKRPLTLVTTEDRFSLIHLQNMMKVALAAATVISAHLNFASKSKIFKESQNEYVERIFGTLEIV